MKWTEIRIKTTEEAYDAISEMLNGIGAGGVAIEDPNEIRREILRQDSLDYADDEFMASLGVDVLVKAYFPGDRNRNELIQLVREKIKFISNFLHTGEGFMGYAEVEEEDWSTAWKKYYKPFFISDRVVIKPSWLEYKPAGNEFVVELDPGMAFGTGTHETTMMCAKALEKLIRKDDSVIDVGCGSGILSIIAAKLGAGHIEAMDVDSVAVRVANENSVINHVKDKIHVFTGVLNDLDKQKADIVVANIIADVIVRLSEIMSQYVKPGGYFVTSGIIKERRDEIVETYVNKGFLLQEIFESGEWVAIVFKCQDSL
jgi:ribosomal protein L11 methyltransferase